jgi:hypothetical protein
MSILVITPSAVGHVSAAQYSQNPRAMMAAITAKPSPISHGVLRNEPKFISGNIHRTAYTNAIESGKRSIRCDEKDLRELRAFYFGFVPPQAHCFSAVCSSSRDCIPFITTATSSSTLPSTIAGLTFHKPSLILRRGQPFCHPAPKTPIHGLHMQRLKTGIAVASLPWPVHPMEWWRIW